MGKKGKKKQALAVVQENNASSEDEGPTPLKKRRLLRKYSSHDYYNEDYESWQSYRKVQYDVKKAVQNAKNKLEMTQRWRTFLIIISVQFLQMKTCLT